MNPVQFLIQEIESNGLWEEDCLVKRNEYLTVQGSTDSRLFYVRSGCVRAFLQTEYEEHTIRFGYTGDVIAALDTYITGQPSSFYLQALRKTEVRTISKNAFKDFVRSTPNRFDAWVYLLELLVYQQLERERDLLISSPLERYLRVLDRSPAIFQEVPHKYIASYLRMTPETLSRLKKG